MIQIISSHPIYQTTVADSAGGALGCSAIGMRHLCCAAGYNLENGGGTCYPYDRRKEDVVGTNSGDVDSPCAISAITATTPQMCLLLPLNHSSHSRPTSPVA